MPDRSDRHFTLVLGYVRGVDRLPRLARKLGLTRRHAFVLDSYRPGEVDAYFDAEMYAALLRATRTALLANAVLAEHRSGRRVDVTEPAALLAELESLAVLEPLPAVTFLRGSQGVAVAMYEPFVNAGGPEPYHDSHVIALYTEEDVSRALTAAAFREAESLGGRGALVRANSMPDAAGLLGWLASLVRRLLTVVRPGRPRGRGPGGQNPE